MIYPDDYIKAPVELKPCPFCGYEYPHLMREDCGPHTGYRVHCIACGTTGPGFTGEDAQGTACDFWNYRVCDGTRKPAYRAICPNCMTEFRTRSDYPTCPDCGYQFDDSD